MNHEVNSPGIVSRAVVIVLIVLAIALVGGVWALSAQGTIEEREDPPDPAVPISSFDPDNPGPGVPVGACGAFDAGEEGGKRLQMQFFPDCDPPVQAVCPIGEAKDQAMPATLVALRFLYRGPFHQTCFLVPASDGVPEIGAITG